jgi:hypothetical protein
VSYVSQESVRDRERWLDRTAHLLSMAPLLAASNARHKRKRQDS